MGYKQGEGLGKDGTGEVEPVKAQRWDRRGLGSNTDDIPLRHVHVESKVDGKEAKETETQTPSKLEARLKEVVEERRLRERVRASVHGGGDVLYDEEESTLQAQLRCTYGSAVASALLKG